MLFCACGVVFTHRKHNSGAGPSLLSTDTFGVGAACPPGSMGPSADSGIRTHRGPRLQRCPSASCHLTLPIPNTVIFHHIPWGVVSVSHCYWNTLPQNQWLETTQFYSLTTFEFRSLKCSDCIKIKAMFFLEALLETISLLFSSSQRLPAFLGWQPLPVSSKPNSLFL